MKINLVKGIMNKLVFNSIVLVLIVLIAPSNSKAQTCDSLTSFYKYNAYANGCMVSIVSKKEIRIQRLYYNLSPAPVNYDTLPFKLYVKKGSSKNFEITKSAWTFLDNYVFIQKFDSPNLIALKQEIEIKKGDTISFYLTEPTGKALTLLTKNITEPNKIFTDSSISVLPATLVYGNFKACDAKPIYQWNGTVAYCSPSTVELSSQTEKLSRFSVSVLNNEFLETRISESMYNQNAMLTLTIFDVLAKKMLTTKITSSKQFINISSLSKGVYICCIMNDNLILEQKKIIIN